VESELIAKHAPRIARAAEEIARSGTLEDAEKQAKLFRSKVIADVNRGLRGTPPSERPVYRQNALLTLADAVMTSSRTDIHRYFEQWFGGRLSEDVLSNALGNLNRRDAERLLNAAEQQERYLRFLSTFVASPPVRKPLPDHSFHRRIHDVGSGVLDGLDMDSYLLATMRALATEVLSKPRQQRSLDGLRRRYLSTHLEIMRKTMLEFYGGTVPFVAVSSYFASNRGLQLPEGEPFSWPDLYEGHMPLGTRNYGPYHWMDPGMRYIQGAKHVHGLWRQLIELDPTARKHYQYLASEMGTDPLGIAKGKHLSLLRRVPGRFRSLFKR